MADAATATRHLSDVERNIIAKRKLKGDVPKTEFKVTPISATGGYLGVYFRVEMTIISEDDPKGCITHQFFMKSEPDEGGWATKMMRENRLFEKEVNFYKDVSDVFRGLISTDVYPECFLAAPGKIILTDATTLGYRTLENLHLSVDFEHVKQAILAIARFHSASLIYEEKTGRKCSDDFPESAREPCYKSGTMAMDFVAVGGRAIAALAPHIAKYKNDPEAIADIQATMCEAMLKLQHYCEEDVAYRKAICHGDSWPANFLFKYDSDGKPMSALLIDFQMTRYMPPAYELMVTLYVSLSLSELKKWRIELLNLYYETISQEISNAGLSVASVYSRQEFQQTCIYYQVVGVIHSLLIFPISRIGAERMAEVSRDTETALRFYYGDRSDHLIESYNTIPLMREYMDSVVEELYENFIKTKRGYTDFTP